MALNEESSEVAAGDARVVPEHEGMGRMRCVIAFAD